QRSSNFSWENSFAKQGAFICIPYPPLLKYWDVYVFPKSADAGRQEILV
ncbi:hypothetical protein AVEN_214901-1, partial [Araneus ventricosus]